MRRREFIAGLGGAAALPFAARAQQGERVRRIGVLMAQTESDPFASSLMTALTRALQQLGWIKGRNIEIDTRWTGANSDRIQIFAGELVGLRPDVILANATPLTAALQRETRSIPIVFLTPSDPVGSGFVASLARPGGNITGFINMEAEMGGKWLQLLIEVAPNIKRAAIMFNPDTAAGKGTYYLPSFEAAARSLNIEPIAAPVRSDVEIETASNTLGGELRGGLVVMPDVFMLVHRAPVILQTARNNIPAVYYHPFFARDGGLLGYGADSVDIFRRSASYVDRILLGANPSELPVQLPTKFEMIINLRTAKALGLTIPVTLLATADEVIE